MSMLGVEKLDWKNLIKDSEINDTNVGKWKK